MRLTRLLEVQSHSVFAFAVFLQVHTALKFQGQVLTKIQGQRKGLRASCSLDQDKAFHAVLNDTSLQKTAIPEISGEHKN